MPLLLIFFPFITVAMANGEFLEWGFIGFSLILALFAMIQGYVYHRKPIPYILAIIGFAVFIISKILFERAFCFGTFMSTSIYVGSGISVLVAHYLNHKWTNNAKCKCNHEGDK